MSDSAFTSDVRFEIIGPAYGEDELVVEKRGRQSYTICKAAILLDGDWEDHKVWVDAKLSRADVADPDSDLRPYFTGKLEVWSGGRRDTFTFTNVYGGDGQRRPSLSKSGGENTRTRSAPSRSKPPEKPEPIDPTIIRAAHRLILKYATLDALRVYRKLLATFKRDTTLLPHGKLPSAFIEGTSEQSAFITQLVASLLPQYRADLKDAALQEAETAIARERKREELPPDEELEHAER